MQTEQITQRLALMNGAIPQTINNSIANSDGVDMSLSRRAMFILSIGANAGSVSAWMQESADNSTWTANGSAGAFSNSGASNVSQTGLVTANKEYSFEVNASQLTTGKRYVRLQVKEVNTAAVVICIVAFGDEAEHKPNNGNNGANVATQNVVS
jgi:hypothetical protein